MSKNRKIKMVNDEVNTVDVNEEDIEIVEEATEEPEEEKVTVELTPTQLNALMTLLGEETESDEDEVTKESKFKKFLGALKPTKKKVAIAGGVLGGVAVGVIAAVAKSKGNDDVTIESYPELPDDNYDDYSFEEVETVPEEEPEENFDEEI